MLSSYDEKTESEYDVHRTQVKEPECNLHNDPRVTGLAMNAICEYWGNLHISTYGDKDREELDDDTDVNRLRDRQPIFAGNSRVTEVSFITQVSVSFVFKDV